MADNHELDALFAITSVGGSSALGAYKAPETSPNVDVETALVKGLSPGTLKELEEQRDTLLRIIDQKNMTIAHLYQEIINVRARELQTQQEADAFKVWLKNCPHTSIYPQSQDPTPFIEAMKSRNEHSPELRKAFELWQRQNRFGPPMTEASKMPF